MVVYRPRRRLPMWAKAVGVLFVTVFVVAIGIWIRAVTRPSPEERLHEAVATMTAQLDVLRLSHYTPDVVDNGVVRLDSEYQAAVEDVRHVRETWQSVRDVVPEQQRADVDRMVADLSAAVESRRSPEEVDRLVEELIVRLRGLTAAPSGRRGESTAVIDWEAETG